MEALCYNGSRVHTLYDRVSQLLDSYEYSDCSFRVGSEIIRAHKLILVTCSPVFKVMFYGPMAEAKEILISDIEPEVFKLMIAFIYRDRVDIHSLEVACGLLYASKKYMLTDLTKVCIKYFEKCLSTKNVMCILPFAEWIQEDDLVTRCLKLICKHGDYILSKEIDHLPSTSLRKILEQNCINITEKELIMLADHWVHDECVKQELPPTDENKRMLLSKTGNFSLLRFFSLNSTDIPWLNELNILTQDEKELLQIILANKLPKEKPLFEKFDPDNLDLSIFSMSVSKCDENTINPTTVSRHPMKLDWIFCCRPTIRTATPLIIEHTNQNIKVRIKSNKTIFLSSFSIPSRQSPEATFPNESLTSYLENLECTIYGNADNKDKASFKCVKDTNYNACTNIDIPRPYIFNEEECYTVSFTWLDVSSPPYKYPLCYRPVMSADSTFTFDDNFENLFPCGSFVLDLKFCV